MLNGSRSVIHRVVASLLLCGACSGPVAAAESSFSFVEGGLLLADHGGARINTSVAMSRHMYLAADYIERDESFGSTSFGSLGLGAHWRLGSSLQMFSALSLVAGNGDGHAQYEEEDLAAIGLGLTAGLRGQVGEKLELLGSVRAATVGGEVSIGARYYFTQRFAAGLDLTRHHYNTQVGVMLRYDFSRR